MNPSSRVIVNTTAQYIKTFVNVILTLYSTRLILQVLGIDDFGIYTLLAGVISMLSFATNALATTTQRFLSYYQGRSSIEEQKNIFANSFYIHILLGTTTFVVLIMLTPYLFNGFLNIPENRLHASMVTYVIVIAILLASFFSSPFRAIIISHENIVYLTILDIIDGVLKVVLAIALSHITYDKLIGYALFLFGIQIFNLFAIGFYALYKYNECILPNIRRVNRRYISQISSFAGWTIYSIGCVIGRTQGIAILLNKFFGAMINAAYGLGFQISGYVNFMSESLLNAIRPQLMRAEGENNRNRMLLLAEISSKYSFFLLSCLAIPCVVEMETLLSIWLKEVPNYSVLFCRMVLIASIADSTTCGLWVANQAIGNVKQYSIVVNTTKLATFPVSYFLIWMGCPIYTIAVCFVFFEFLCAILRIPFLAKTGNLNWKIFLVNVFGRVAIPLVVLIMALTILCYINSGPYRIIFTFTIPNIIYFFAIFLFGMSKEEKKFIANFINNRSERHDKETYK